MTTTKNPAIAVPKTKREFKLSYEMLATEKHSIDAQTLGNSLTNMAAILQEANKILNGESAEAKVEVQAHKPGSFVVEFVTWLQEGGIDVLKTIGIGSAAGAVVSANLMAALKALKNRNVAAKTKLENGQWQLTLDDGELIECTDDVHQLLSNHKVRKRIDAIINKPASSDENATVRFIAEDKTETAIMSDDIKYFKAPSRAAMQAETIYEEVKNVVFTVIAMESNTGWKIKLPSREEVTVRMEDEGFLERINNRERSFSKGDMFEVKLKTVEKELDGKQSLKYSITQVLRHRVEHSKKVI